MSPILFGERPLRARAVQWLVVVLCLLSAGYYLASTTWSVWHHGWTEMFADQFQLYAKLLELPFPESVLTPDNQHRHVVSHLGRLAELHWGGGGQAISIAVNLGMLWLLWLTLAAWTGRERALPLATRAALLLLATLALMWRGSARTQFHGNEGLQVYLVILCAIIAVHCVESMRSRPRWQPLAGALLAATAATFSFASGVAVFAVFVALVVVRRVAPRWIVASVVYTALALSAYVFLMPGGGAVRASLTFAPLQLLQHATTWLASFWTTGWLAYAGEGVVGIDAAGMTTVTPPLGAWLVASAQALFALVGGPGLLDLASVIGALGVLLLFGCAWRAWRDPAAVSRVEVLGIGLAGFAMVVALLVALGRNWLFIAVPGQLLADRYVIWTNVFWLGLALAIGARVGRGPLAAATAGAVAIALAVLLYPTHQIGSGWAQAVERLVEQRAAQIAAGVHGQGMAEHTATGSRQFTLPVLEVLRRHQAGMFRHPRQRLIGASPVLPPTAAALASISVPRRVEEDGTGALAGWHIEGRLLDPGLRARIDGLVVAERSGRIVGIGEFSFAERVTPWRRIDRVAEGFDAYFRADADCSGLRLYGVDAAATAFVALAEIADCAQPDR
ncbi:MAG: hypothetical protein IPH76_03270 [Xanthomonadales bacterium]|nr:hypothetical protein [Xanthomonadales bacterium]